MKISSQQKAVIVLCTALIVMLSLITVLNRPDIALRDTVDYKAAAEQDRQLEAEYQDYLASIKTDPSASQKLLDTLVTNDDIKSEVDAAFAFNDPVELPTIPDSALKISSQAGREALLSYFVAVGKIHNTIEQIANNLSGDLFVDDIGSAELERQHTQVNQAVIAMGSVTVPKEAVSFHK